MNIVIGKMEKIRVNGLYSDGTKKPLLIDLVTVTSSDETTGVVGSDPAGDMAVQGQALGTFSLNAELKSDPSIKGSKELTVVAEEAALVGLEIVVGDGDPQPAPVG